LSDLPLFDSATIATTCLRGTMKKPCFLGLSASQRKFLDIFDDISVNIFTKKSLFQKKLHFH